jgi:hypothetical protein
MSSNPDVTPSRRRFEPMRFLPYASFVFCLLTPIFSCGQQPVPSPQEAEKPAPPPPAKEQSSSNTHHKTLPAFLILGTVFNEKAYAFPGVEVRIRRKGEKKFRYEMYTNSRGEFAVRVPEGIEYEVVVTQKKYKEQTQEVAANMADVQKRLTFKLETIAPAKSGGSK